MSNFKPSLEMTFMTVEADRKRLLCYCHELKTPTLFFDLSQVTHCDSAGLALLIEAKRLTQQYKKNLHIQKAPKAIHALAEFYGVEKILWSVVNDQ